MGSAPHYVSAALWNVVLVWVVTLIHGAFVKVYSVRNVVPFREVAMDFGFPSYPLIVALAVVQGTSQEVMKGLQLYSESAGWVILLILSFGSIPFAILLYTAGFLKRGLRGKWFPYPDEDKSFFVPRGVWLPQSENTRFGAMYADYIPAYRYGHVVLHCVPDHPGITYEHYPIHPTGLYR